MHLVLATVGFVLVAAPVTDPLTYTLPVTRDGKTVTRVSFRSWNGEYPMPAIDLNSKTPGTTTVQAYPSVRTLAKPVTCTIKNGIYHPWSQQPGSTLGFFALLPFAEYTSTVDDALSDAKVKAGDVVSQVIYLAEGNCHGMLIPKGKKKSTRELEFDCAELEKPTWKKNPGATETPPFEEQWLYVQCQEGAKAFIRDTALLKAPGAREGTVVEYGKAGPAQ